MFASSIEYKRRYDICKSCDKFLPLTRQCDECKCFMPMKCKFSNQKCPLDYWDISSSASDTDNLETL